MTQGRMQELAYFSLMVLFLITATFHGVNGVYNALINQGVTGKKKIIMKLVLSAASLLLIAQGLRTAVVWADGVPI
jgi:succinate dehydrogenase subunit D (EC 1.3.5.1)